MKNTTLCYVEKNGRMLMMHRIKKKNDLNHDKWVGIGGKFEENESPEDCLLREAKEETGLTLTSWRLRGVVTFLSDLYETEYMFLYTADGFTGEMRQCDEGVLEWIPEEEVGALPMWEGDAVFFRLIRKNHPFFSLKLQYCGDRLVQAVLDGKILPPGTDIPGGRSIEKS